MFSVHALNLLIFTYHTKKKEKKIFIFEAYERRSPSLFKVRRLLYHKHEKGSTTNYVAKYFFTAEDNLV